MKRATPFPKVVQSRPSEGPRVKYVLPRYVTVKDAKKVARTVEWDRYPGQVFADEDANGNLIGVEIIG